MLHLIKSITKKIRKYPRLIWFVIYMGILVVVVANQSIPAFHKALFLSFAGVIFYFCDVKKISLRSPKTNIPRWFWWGLLITGLLFFVMSRAMLFWRYGSLPLGYDSGFYLQYIRYVTESLTINPAVLTTSHFTYSWWFPFIALGFSPTLILNFTHLWHQLLTLGAFVLLVRSTRPNSSPLSTGAIAVFLFAISVNQFMAFWWMFYKQSLALPFFILALAMFWRKSWLAIPLAIAAVAFHLQSGVPFLAGVVIFTAVLAIIARRRHEPLGQYWFILVGSIIGIALVALAIKGPRELVYYFQYVWNLKGFATTAVSWQVQQAAGLFINFSVFSVNILLILPFALIGIMSCYRWLPHLPQRRQLLFPILIGIFLFFSLIPFIYQHRYLIFLDLLFITAAVPVFYYFLEQSWQKTWERNMSIFLILGMLIFSAAFVGLQKPQITPAEITALNNLRPLLDQGGGAYVMVTSSLYTPWAWAMTDHETIAPGSLQWNRWDLNQWNDFWYSPSNDRRHQLLGVYAPRTLYLFIGEQQKLPGGLKSFLENDQSCQRLNQYIWRYQYPTL